MYERFYGLKERPFSLLPDPDFLFLGENHRAALDLLELAILNQSGFCVISGEIGAGKTTLIRELLNRLGGDIRVGLVSNTHRSFGELMQWIMAAYGLECGSNDRLELHKQFIDFVIQNYARKQTTLLIIDEAQNLSISAMEELRMLSNVNSDKHLVLQVILVGQQQLRDKLGKPELAQFAQRIGIDFHLSGLGEAETREYIRHRVSHAGATPELFSDAACRAVHRFSNGIPRLINRICDLSLVYGYAEECSQITPQLVQTVVEDQHMSRVLDAAGKQWVPASLKTAVQGARSSAVPQSAGAQDTAVPVEADLHTAQSDSSARSADRVHRSGKPGATETAVPVTPTVARQRPDVRTDVAHQDVAEPPVESIADAVDADPVPVQVPEVDDAVPVASKLHALVLDAEKNKRGRNRKTHGGFWLSMVIVIIAAGAAWSSQDLWYPFVAEQVARLTVPRPHSTPVAAVVEAQPQPQPQLEAVAAIAEEDPVPNDDQTEPLTDGSEPVSADVVQEQAAAEKQAQETARLDTAEAADGEDAEPSPVQDTVTEEQMAQEAELRREQQRLAKVKEESARLERERIAAERKLAEQRKARVALEQKVKREREKLREVSRDASGVAVQRARPAHPMASVPKTANTLQRTQVSKPPSVNNAADTRVEGFFLVPAGPQGAADNGAGPKASTATQPAGVAAVPESGKQPPVATTGIERNAVASQPSSAVDRTTRQDSAGQAETQSDKFLTNPCNGPTARFMSTCF